MNIKIDTHAHSIVSGHAYHSMKEMIIAAKEKGMEAIALTEHAPNMPGTTGLFYFQNYFVVPKVMEGVRVFMGVELNILDETGAVDLPEELYENIDLVIASIHRPENCYGASRGMELNTQAYLNVMKKKGINIIGHPDDSRYPVDYDTLVSAAKEHHVLIEINNSSTNKQSYRLNAVENQKKLLELCKKYKTPISLGSDAHIDMDLGNFNRALSIIESCDFPEELIVNRSINSLYEYINCSK